MTGSEQRPRNARGNVRAVGKRNRGIEQPVPRRRGRRFWALVAIGALMVIAGCGELAAKSLVKLSAPLGGRRVVDANS